MLKRHLTLIELLVVVAILMMLMSLLGPSLRTALDQAKTLTCSQNLKVMYTSSYFYADDFGNVLPPANTATKLGSVGDFKSIDNGGQYGNHGTFMSFIQAYRMSLPLNKWNGSGGIKEPDVFICPADETSGFKYGLEVEELRSRDKRWTTYSHARNVWNNVGDRFEVYHEDGDPKKLNGTNFVLPLSDVRNPSQTHLLLDSINGHGHVNDPWTNPGVVLNDLNQRVVARDEGNGLQVSIRIDHSNGYNSLMFDGSYQYNKFPVFPECIKIPWLKKN